MSKIITLGCDPECFVSKDGKIISAHALIEGDKKNPQKVQYGAVQVDGTALEFNIDAAATEAEWMRNINTVLDILTAMIPGHKIEACPVAEFGFEYLRTLPAKATELGCEADWDAYTVAVNPRPNGELPFRSAAGHIHFGIPEAGGEAPVDNIDYIGWIAAKVRELDFYIGLPSLFYDNDTKRRELYGKAGAFRPKRYGMEYRTPSNQWLGNDNLKRWAYQASMYAMEQIDKGICLADKYDDIQNIINKSDKAAAARIIKAEGLILPKGVVV